MLGNLRWPAIWLGCLACGLGLGRLTTDDRTELRFLSVGQGDCAVFRCQGLTVLIDVGPAKPDSDAPAREIARKLRALGIARIDLALLSHPDADHIGGLRGLSPLIPIGQVAVMKHFIGNRDLEFWLKSAGIPDSELVALSPGDELELGEHKLEIDAAPLVAGDSDNHGSMLIRLVGRGSAVDFTGDADEAAERSVLHDGDWRAQILKAGHHGSKTATCDAWLSEVRPTFVVISCGKDNPYGHPHRDTLQRIASAGAAAVRTDQEGDIVFEEIGGEFVRRK